VLEELKRGKRGKGEDDGRGFDSNSAALAVLGHA